MLVTSKGHFEEVKDLLVNTECAESCVDCVWNSKVLLDNGTTCIQTLLYDNIYERLNEVLYG